MKYLLHEDSHQRKRKRKDLEGVDDCSSPISSPEKYYEHCTVRNYSILCGLLCFNGFRLQNIDPHHFLQDFDNTNSSVPDVNIQSSPKRVCNYESPNRAPDCSADDSLMSVWDQRNEDEQGHDVCIAKKEGNVFLKCGFQLLFYFPVIIGVQGFFKSS